VWSQADDHPGGENDHPQQLEQVDAAISKTEQAAAQVVECEDRGWLDVPEIDVELQAFVKSTRVGKEQRLTPFRAATRSVPPRSLGISRPCVQRPVPMATSRQPSGGLDNGGNGRYLVMRRG
jgi:hypothetical protein